MSITCQICQKEFAKIIPWQHLNIHGITSAEYKKQHGSLYSAETLELFQRRVPHNKGQKVTDECQLANIRSAIETREQRFRNGEFVRGTSKTAEQKAKLSLMTKAYAAQHREEIKERAKKAVETKRQQNYDFGGNMRGKKHSEHTKQVIGRKSRLSNQRKSQLANNRIKDRIADADLTLRNNIAEWQLELHCNQCSTDFSFTKQYFHLSKITATICPTCYPRAKPTSGQELELYQFIKSLRADAIQGYRDRYHSKEIDIFIPDLKIGIEYNGLYWHSEPVLLHNNRSPKSDYEKLLEFQSQNIRLVQVFEDEWVNQKDIVKSRITNILGQTALRIAARQCVVREISPKIAAQFCNTNHIMGSGRSNVRLGLYHNDELVAVMTFAKSNLSRKVTEWELNRYAPRIGVNIIGGASKLFRAFLRLYNPATVISFSDNRWSNGELYQQLGFEKVNSGTPNYWYTLPNTSRRIHRFNLRKSANDDINATERELRSQQGYSRIWDSGSSRWQWSNKNGAAPFLLSFTA